MARGDEGEIGSVPGTRRRRRPVRVLRSSKILGGALALLWILAAPAGGQETEEPKQQSEAASRSPSEGGWARILSRPLPGTLGREDADLADSLERALAGFDGIESARVVIVRPPTAAFQEPAPRRAAVQVALSPEVPRLPSWTETVVAFILQAIPDLDPQELTIVDSAGHRLYAAGQAQAPQVQPSGEAAEDEATGGSSAAWWWLLVVALGGLAAIAAILQRQRRRAQAAAVAEPGPLSFLESLSNEELRTAFGGERAEVVGAALSQLPPRAAARLRRAVSVPAHVQAPRNAPSAEVLRAMGEALGAKTAGNGQ